MHGRRISLFGRPGLIVLLDARRVGVAPRFTGSLSLKVDP